MLLQYRVIDNKKKEMLDIVDINDNVISVESRESFKDKAFNPQGKYVRVVNCFILNKKGQIWIPIRSPNKRSFPNSLDFSCGGYVQSGEAYKDAMISEMREETNIVVDSSKLELLGKLTPLNDLINVFMEVYKYVTDQDIDYNKSDFTSAQWYTKDELLTKLKSGFPAKNHLLPVLLKFQDQL